MPNVSHGPRDPPAPAEGLGGGSQAPHKVCPTSRATLPSQGPGLPAACTVASLWTLSANNLSTCSSPSLVPRPPAATIVSVLCSSPKLSGSCVTSVTSGHMLWDMFPWPALRALHIEFLHPSPAQPPGLQPNGHCQCQVHAYNGSGVA